MAMIDALGYVVAESTDLSKWKTYGEQVLGMMTADAPGGGLYLKMDERNFRIAVVPGATDRYLASGWEVADEAAFDAAVAALKAADVAITAGTDAEKAVRCVADMAVFTDASDNRHEITYGHNGASAPFVSPLADVKGFKTGDMGMGHTVLPAPATFDATEKLFTDVLGFRVSDEFGFQPAPEAPVMRMHFMHCNGRHHSLALGEMPNPAGCIHIMVEVESREEVDAAEKRQQEHGIKLMATLGQHENDNMTSFYMLTPGNFALEYGHGGKIIEHDSYATTQGERVSIWGHDFSVGFQ